MPLGTYVRRQQTRVRVRDDGKVPVGDPRQASAAPPRAIGMRCRRPDGDRYYLRHAPVQKAKPIILLLGPGF